MTNRLDLTVAVEQEALSDGTKIYVSHCLELGIASQGATIEEATENVREAVTLWLECASQSEIDSKLPFLRERKSFYTTRIEVPYGQTAGAIGV
jgi:predicted RNase H-like HicB family nuclease